MQKLSIYKVGKTKFYLQSCCSDVLQKRNDTQIKALAMTILHIVNKNTLFQAVFNQRQPPLKCPGYFGSL